MHTEKGTRPGDGFADVLWALTFSKWLVRLETHLAAEEVLTRIPWNHAENLTTAPGPTMVTKGIVAWADDVAVMADSEDPLQAVHKLVYLTEVLVKDLYDFGMTPNFGPGKTEAVLDLKGKNSHALRRKIFNDDKGQVDIQPARGQPLSLRVVYKYKHLGGYITHGGKLTPEIHHRIAQGRKTCKDYKAKLYANKAIPLAHRLQVLRSTALKAATYNTGCWPSLTVKDSQLWTHGMMALYRTALHRTMHYMDLRHMTDSEVLGLCQALHPLTELRLNRLRSYGQYLQRHCKLLWAILAEEQQWQQQLLEDFEWLYNNIKGLTIHPSPTHDMEYWNDLIRNRPRTWKGLLKRTATHAALQQRIHADVDWHHRQALRALADAGIPIDLQEERNMEYAYLCFICNQEFETYMAWAVHSFKRHGRTQPGRTLQTGTTCRACAKSFNTPARLARHFRTVPKCAQTVAAQGWEVPLQPGFGSMEDCRKERDTAMCIWTYSNAETLPASTAWATTPQAKALLLKCETEDWTTEEEATEDILQYLQQEPVSYDELKNISDKLQEDAVGPCHHVATEALHSLMAIARRSIATGYKIPKDISASIFLRTQLQVPTKIHRLPTAYRYVLHVFSGVRRDGDLHGALLQLTPPDGATIFPISIDIVLSPQHCDLLDPQQQKRWLDWAKEGAVYMAIGGPPCETWSVSRLRWLEEHEGPRPLRDGGRTMDYIWALPQLRVREARQVRVANALLQFCILLFLLQVLNHGIAILERPDEPGPRGMLVPPSIWRLPLMQFIKSASTVFPIHIKQGYWNALSPKPTLLLVTVPKTTGPEILKCLEDFRVRADLPPPITMGKASKHTFNTAALKRYPRALCQGMAAIAERFVENIPYVHAETDKILPTAQALRQVYLTSDDQMDDGVDFAGDRN